MGLVSLPLPPHSLHDPSSYFHIFSIFPFLFFIPYLIYGPSYLVYVYVYGPFNLVYGHSLVYIFHFSFSPWPSCPFPSLHTSFTILQSSFILILSSSLLSSIFFPFILYSAYLTLMSRFFPSSSSPFILYTRSLSLPSFSVYYLLLVLSSHLSCLPTPALTFPHLP